MGGSSAWEGGATTGVGVGPPTPRPGVRRGWPSWSSTATLAGVSSYSIGEAKTQLSKLVHMAEEGEEVVLRRGRHPVARLTAIAVPEDGIKRRPGRMRGRIRVHEDFDEWPPDIARALGVVD